MIILSNPSFSASEIRCSIRLTGRISPDNPTYAERQMFFGTGKSALEDNTEATTAKSIAG
jgi:hypothetical protein